MDKLTEREKQILSLIPYGIENRISRAKLSHKTGLDDRANREYIEKYLVEMRNRRLGQVNIL